MLAMVLVDGEELSAESEAKREAAVTRVPNRVQARTFPLKQQTGVGVPKKCWSRGLISSKFTPKADTRPFQSQEQTPHFYQGQALFNSGSHSLTQAQLASTQASYREIADTASDASSYFD